MRWHVPRLPGPLVDTLLNQYHIALNVILEVREKCTIVVLIGQAE